ncbi:MAG: carbon-nitrogen hydrolase family protein [Phycisphaeraceae bacterium]|nr:carbon-nitrogen hydrolase family protein [Phycisphaeraceae bacterium]MCB9848843.1 carbon-nitrogen hydrolase family protein [Phycisphaeraceae bacterium]
MTTTPHPETLSGIMTVALISDVFSDNDAEARLFARLEEARSKGAELACLPEIPCNPWAPATRTACDEDAEDPQGPRHTMMSRAAEAIGIGLIGGAIVRDPKTGARRNTALVFDAQGECIARYAKLHVPEEPGFWESSHYEAGVEAPQRIDGFTLPIGVQICSDNNRPQGAHLLAAQGVGAVFVPRATVEGLYEKVWKVVWRANAITGGMYVLSVNRPRPELGVDIGGPSIVVAPDGEVVLESREPVAIATLSAEAIERARVDYPAYLAVRSEIYAKAWGEIDPRPARV